MSELRQYWEKLQYVKTNKKGKHVHKFRCLICQKIFTNHNNATSHVASCLKNHKEIESQTTLSSYGIGAPPIAEVTQQIDSSITEHEPDQPVIISREISALIELIAEANIPYTQIANEAWVNFVHILNPNVELPSTDVLRNLIIQYSKEKLDEGLKDFKDSTCGMAVDGATLIQKHCYAFILISPVGLRLAGITELKSQTAASLARAIADVLLKCKDYSVNISGIVSDNCPALVKALTDADPKNESTLLAMIGSEILRCSCSAHTGQLVISDLIKSTYLKDFYENVVSTIDWLKHNKKDFDLLVPQKIPSFVSTRWNTLYSCSKYLFNNHEQIDSFLTTHSEYQNRVYLEKLESFRNGKIKNEPTMPVPPPIFQIPNEWGHVIDALKVINDFTEQIEKDLALQQHVFVAVIRAIHRLEELNTPVATELLINFRERFQTTADLMLSKLAYYLTPAGICEYRAFPNQEKRMLLKELKSKFLELTSKLPKEKTLFFAAMFRFFMDNYTIDEGDSPFYLYDELKDEKVIIQGINHEQPVSYFDFAMVCKALISLPASEAMVERCFSQVKSISTDFNRSMKSDIFIALATIKLTSRYKRKYFFPSEVEECM